MTLKSVKSLYTGDTCSRQYTFLFDWNDKVFPHKHTVTRTNEEIDFENLVFKETNIDPTSTDETYVIWLRGGEFMKAKKGDGRVQG